MSQNVQQIFEETTPVTRGDGDPSVGQTRQRITAGAAHVTDAFRPGATRAEVTVGVAGTPVNIGPADARLLLRNLAVGSFVRVAFGATQAAAVAAVATGWRVDGGTTLGPDFGPPPGSTSMVIQADVGTALVSYAFGT